VPSNASVCIVGGSGYLGTALARALAGANRVRIADVRAPEESLLAAGVEYMPCDVTVYDDCRRALEGVEIVFHRVGLAGNLPSMSAPGRYYRINVEGTLNILRACVEAGARRLVFDSTEFVYGRQVASPVAEDQRPAPCSIYGATKLVCEQAIVLYARMHGLSAIVLRYCRVRDAGKDDLVSRLAAKARDGEPIELYDGGRPSLDYLHLDDATAAAVLAADAQLSGVALNVGPGEGMSLNEIATTILQKTGGDATAIVYRDAGRSPPAAEFQFGPESFFMSADQARSLLGWIPRKSMRDMIEDTVGRALDRRAAKA
jgi:nucleoside-diphosphate-sugar epimerase